MFSHFRSQKCPLKGKHCSEKVLTYYCHRRLEERESKWYAWNKWLSFTDLQQLSLNFIFKDNYFYLKIISTISFAAVLFVFQITDWEGGSCGTEEWPRVSLRYSIKLFHQIHYISSDCVVLQFKRWCFVLINRICGTLHSVDQYLNLKLTEISVTDPDKYPHMVSFITDYFVPI